MRFTGRDPVKGGFREPLTLHAYLYCANNPINWVDISGESASAYLEPLWEAAYTSTAIVLSAWSKTSKAAAPISMFLSVTEASLHTLNILYLRSVQHIAMNAILYESFSFNKEDLLPVGWDLLWYGITEYYFEGFGEYFKIHDY